MSWKRVGEHDFIDEAAGRNIKFQPEDDEYDAYYWLVETATGKTIEGGGDPGVLGVPMEVWQAAPPAIFTVAETAMVAESLKPEEKEEPVTETTPGAGHNSGETPTNVAGERLRSIIDRIERLDEEKKALSSDIKDIFAEAKSAGFDAKVLRMLISLRKLEPAEVEERETLLDVYRRALNM